MTKITEYLDIIMQGNDLSFDQAKALLDNVFDGDVPDAQIASFLTATRIKGTVPTELAGFAGSLRSHAVPVKVDGKNLIDTCGTGGATVKTFNISTASALVAAGAGAYVAKHGNRAITSQCGSADVLAELGVKIAPGPDKVAECIKQAHIGFMFAPMFHPAMKFVQPIRKTLDFRTVFNILGPLANPASASAQVIGVADENLLDTIVETLKILGAKRAMVVHSQGMDEISTAGITKIRQLKNGEISSIELEPAKLGIAPACVDDLKSGDAKANAEIIRNILNGKETGCKRDIIILNAAAAIIVAEQAEDFESAMKLATSSVEEGKALACLEKLIEISNS